jgi:hypothetical protein
MDTIYILFISVGSYEDVAVIPLRAFATKEEADNDLKEQERQIHHNNGLAQAVDNLLTVWRESHPVPVRPENDSSSEYDAYMARFDAWTNELRVEATRLHQLVGYRTDLHVRDSFEEWHLFVKDVPFGAAVNSSER